MLTSAVVYPNQKMSGLRGWKGLECVQQEMFFEDQTSQGVEMRISGWAYSRK